MNKSRRFFISTRAVAPAMVLPLVASTIPPASVAAAPAGSPDPTFAMIETHKKLRAERQALCDQSDDAEFEAVEEHGPRPVELIHWRNYHIGAGEIETRRQTFLEAGEIDPATTSKNTWMPMRAIRRR